MFTIETKFLGRSAIAAGRSLSYCLIETAQSELLVTTKPAEGEKSALTP
jgi:hypothetical protein